MKNIRYTDEAADDLATYRADAARIIGKITRYADTGAGDVTPLRGLAGKRLWVGEYRVLFEEDEDTITITRVAPRGKVYC
jgi:mRNA interferase RelE/StbE